MSDSAGEAPPELSGAWGAVWAGGTGCRAARRARASDRGQTSRHRRLGGEEGRGDEPVRSEELEASVGSAQGAWGAGRGRGCGCDAATVPRSGGAQEGKLAFYASEEAAKARPAAPLKGRFMPLASLRLVGFAGEARISGKTPEDAHKEVFPDPGDGTLPEFVLFSLVDPASPLGKSPSKGAAAGGGASDASSGSEAAEGAEDDDDLEEVGRADVRLRFTSEDERDAWVVASWRHGVDPGLLSDLPALNKARERGYSRWGGNAATRDRKVPPPPAARPPPPPSRGASAE
jgi:hypothetical protein